LLFDITYAFHYGCFSLLLCAGARCCLARLRRAAPCAICRVLFRHADAICCALLMMARYDMRARDDVTPHAHAQRIIAFFDVYVCR